MNSFHGSEELKAKYMQRAELHRLQDEIVQG